MTIPAAIDALPRIGRGTDVRRRGSVALVPLGMRPAASHIVARARLAARSPTRLAGRW